MQQLENPQGGSILILFRQGRDPEIYFNGETDQNTSDLHRWLENFSGQPCALKGNSPDLFPARASSGEADGSI